MRQRTSQGIRIRTCEHRIRGLAVGSTLCVKGQRVLAQSISKDRREEANDKQVDWIRKLREQVIRTTRIGELFTKTGQSGQLHTRGRSLRIQRRTRRRHHRTGSRSLRRQRCRQRYQGIRIRSCEHKAGEIVRLISSCGFKCNEWQFINS